MMINLFRIYIAEKLLGLILFITPKNCKEGQRLIYYIHCYLKETIENINNDFK